MSKIASLQKLSLNPCVLTWTWHVQLIERIIIVHKVVRLIMMIYLIYQYMCMCRHTKGSYIYCIKLYTWSGITSLDYVFLKIHKTIPWKFKEKLIIWKVSRMQQVSDLISAHYLKLVSGSNCMVRDQIWSKPISIHWTGLQPCSSTAMFIFINYK